MHWRKYSWLKTSILTVVGGGFVSAFAAAWDYDKYHFPEDLGSGKLWEYFVAGAAVTFTGLLVARGKREPKEPVDPKKN